MKKIVVYLLISAIVAAFTPLSLHLSCPADCPCLITIDVCHSSAAVGGNAEMLVILDTRYTLKAVPVMAYLGASPSVLYRSSFAFQEERPPKI